MQALSKTQQRQKREAHGDDQSIKKSWENILFVASL